jgi:probable O-glycosylation ligase (exosortase A-associated)
MRGLILALTMMGLLSMAIRRPMVGVIAFEWISFMNPQQDAWGGALANLPWAMLAAVATIMGCLTSGEYRRVSIDGMTILIVLFLSLISLSSVAALGPPDIVNPLYWLVFKSFAFLLVVALLLSDQKRVNGLIWVMVISLGYYGVKGGIFTILTGGRNHVYGSENSMIGDNNQLAVALLMTLPLMNYLRVSSAHRIVGFGVALAMLLTFFSVLGSYSRGAFLALAAVAVLLWWNSRSRLLIGAALVIVLYVGINFMPQNWVQRMDTISTYREDNSAQDRLIIWHEALSLALARPFTGAGFASTQTPSVLHRFFPSAHVRAVHSIWLQVLSDNGFPVFFVWVGMQILGFVNIRRIRRLARGHAAVRWAEDLAKMAEVSMVAFLVGGSFLSLGYYDYDFAILITLSATRRIVESKVREASGGAFDPSATGHGAIWRQRRVGQ